MGNGGGNNNGGSQLICTLSASHPGLIQCHYSRLGFDRRNSERPGHNGLPKKNVVGKRVVVRLTSVVDYRGMFSSPVPRAGKSSPGSGILSCLERPLMGA